MHLYHIPSPLITIVPVNIAINKVAKLYKFYQSIKLCGNFLRALSLALFRIANITYGRSVYGAYGLGPRI